MLVSLYTSRIILNALGVEDYGIYNVVGGVVSMFAFFNSAMSSATQRFLSYEIGKNDFVQLRKTFNATQIIHISMALLIFILAESVGVWFVETYLVVPEERMEAAIWVYHFSVLSFMVSIIQVPYNATIIAHERMKVYAYVSILEVSLKLLIVFVLIWLSFDKLKLYGILHFVVTLIIALIYRIYTLRKFDETQFEIVKEKKLYKTLISYSGWNLFGNLSAVAKGQGINILLNLFFGPVVNAARGIATQVQGAVQGFVNNFQMAVNPQIIKSYAANENEYMNSLIIRSAKFSFYLLFLLSLPIILEIDQILKIWLITVPQYASIFSILVLVVILIDCVSGPLMTAIQATGKVKVYHTVLGTFMLLILPVSYLFLKNGYSPEITLYINIVFSLIALSMRLFLVKKLVDFPIQVFIKEIVFKNIFIVILSISLPLTIRNIMNVSVLRLIIIIILSLIWNALVIYLIGINKSEKTMVKKGIQRIFSKG